jgi:hypothetical protein
MMVGATTILKKQKKRQRLRRLQKMKMQPRFAIL